MKIVFLTTGNILMNTSANIRNIALIKGLIQNDCNVKVISFDNGKIQDPGFKVLMNDVDFHMCNQKIINVICNNSNSTLQKIKTAILPIYRHVKIYDQYKHSISEIESDYLDWKDYDVCITSSDPKSSHLLGLQAKKASHHFKWIQYWGDPMSIDFTNRSWFPFLLKREEKKLFKYADYIIFTNEATITLMKGKYPEYSQKFFSIPTSCCLPQNVVKRTDYGNKNAKLTVGYYGGCTSKNRNISTLVDACLSEPQVKLVLAGGNDLMLPPNQNLEIYGRVNSEDLFKLIKKTDILVAVENLPSSKLSLNGACCQIPGKLNHYALMGRPILVICETELLKKEFGKYEPYYFCHNDIKSIKEALSKIKQDLRTKEYHVVKDFLPCEVAKKLIEIIR